MQLTYRGISYQPNVTKPVAVEQKTDVKYRGVTYRRSGLKNKKIADIFVLKYRGIKFIKVFYH